MTNGQIDAYLAIYNTHSITKAAKELGITQSSLSTKIKILEEELGYTLFIRERGKQKVTLTTKGENFYDLAIEYLELVERMKNVKDVEELYNVNIAVIPTLTPLLETVLGKTNKINADITEMQTEVMYQKLGLHELDIAITTNPRTYVNIPTKLLSEENMVIVTKEKGALDTNKEVYVEWSEEYKFWHMQNIGSVYNLENTADTIEELADLLQDEHNWAIVPAYLGNIYKKKGYRIIENDQFPMYSVTAVYSNEEDEPVIEILKRTFE